jgi:hypothetical protein
MMGIDDKTEDIYSIDELGTATDTEIAAYITQQDAVLCKFAVLEAPSYAAGISAVRKQGFVPLTFKQTVEARLAEYRMRGAESKLFSPFLNSTTGIVTKAGSTKFKIVPKCALLEQIGEQFDKPHMQVNYNRVDGIVLDASDLFCKYGKNLTKNEVLKHPAWRAALEDDLSLLEEYAYWWFGNFAQSRGSEGMPFDIKCGDHQDALYFLKLSSGGNWSEASASYLDSDSRHTFALVRRIK